MNCFQTVYLQTASIRKSKSVYVDVHASFSWQLWNMGEGALNFEDDAFDSD